MVSVVKNFVTVRKTRGDVLRAEEYRSIVEMIKGILKNHKFLELSENYKAFVAHVNDFNNPHRNSNVTYFDEIVKRTYDIYVTMVDEPLSFEDFVTQIVPSVGFIELTRRIVLNRYLYNQVKRWDGSVPESSFVSLSDDWGTQETKMSPFQISLAGGASSEQEFIRLGLEDNTTPIKTILTARNLTLSQKLLPVIFETSSAIPFWIDNSKPYIYPLTLLNNDLTLKFMAVGTPNVTTSVVTLSNANSFIKIIMRENRTLDVLFNGISIASIDQAIDEAEVEFTVSNVGFFTLQATVLGEPVISVGIIDLFDTGRFTQLLVGVPSENRINDTFGLRYLSLFAGLVNPPNYVYVVDENGLYVIDENGNFVIDISDAIDEYVDYTDYLYLIDSDGSYIVDADGNRIFELAYVYKYLVDDDGRHLMDDDGSPVRDVDIILSKAYQAMVDPTDGSYLEDVDGSLMVITV